MTARGLIASVFACGLAMLSGCARDARRTDVTMSSSTTRPSAERHELRDRRHVDVMVRDATPAGLASSLLGRQVRVLIRRDALGVAGSTPMPTTGRWATQSSIDGAVVEMTDQWIVLTGAGKRYSIPHASILMIEMQE
jgi:hypothetical protein